MTSSSPNPPNSTRDQPSAPPPHRPQSSQAWGPAPQQGGRRVLAPISTSASSQSARPTSTAQSPRNPWSPTNSTLASFTATASRSAVRSSSISSGSSPFSPPLHGQQQSAPNSLLSASRGRAIAPPISTPFASAAAASQGSGLGGNSSGGSSRTFRSSPSLPQSLGSPTTASNSAPSAAGQSGSLSKIVIAQLFLLLSTLSKEDKDKSKWDSQVDQIRKLVDSNGMEVYSKYFRRLLVNNSAQIWILTRPSEPNKDYPLLLAEVKKITQDLDQAPKIVESIEHGDGDLFRDFDLSTFMEHFKMSALAKITLAFSFKKSIKSDLRTKADAIISSNLQKFFATIEIPAGDASGDGGEEPSEELLIFIIDRLAQDPPRVWSANSASKLIEALTRRYTSNGVAEVPVAISSTLYLFDLLNSSNPLVRHIHKQGPKATESLEMCKRMLGSVELRDISYEQVAYSLLLMVIARDDPAYDPGTFIAALREHRGGQRLDWQDVVHAFDRKDVHVTKVQFKRLFDALMPLAQEYENFDLQLLWGGSWHHQRTQLAFASAFLSFSPEELDASRIPRLRRAYTTNDFIDAPAEIKAFAELAIRHPFISMDATKTLFDTVFCSAESYTRAQSSGIIDSVINKNTHLFVCSAAMIAKPWGPVQDIAMKQLIEQFVMRNAEHHDFVIYLLGKRERGFITNKLLQTYQANPLSLKQIYEHAAQHGWLPEMTAYRNEFGLDLAAMAHGRENLDLDMWLLVFGQDFPKDTVLGVLCRFLKAKAEDDISSRSQLDQRTTTTLTVRTVYALLIYLGDEGLQEEERTQLQRLCMQAYPRLINYGEGFDEIIDANGNECSNGNGFSDDSDRKMQEFYKDMYGGEKQVRDIIAELQKYKRSDDASEQEMFACLIFGLFDEYNCFGEYPLDALATTAVLFGSLINWKLPSKIALQASIAMVLEAVRDYPPDKSMYKFGLQALLQFQDRLSEWKKLSEHLSAVPGLQGTAIHPVLERIVRENRSGDNEADEELQAADGVTDDLLVPRNQVLAFTCLHLDPPDQADFFKDPDEEVQENVLFILNNISERNLQSKTEDLKLKLKDEYLQWFANYLVESRIKPQPNFHKLYMEMLDMIQDETLWAEVLRETYSCAINVLNAESTMGSVDERKHLNHLGTWLGMMTLARSQAIKFRSISFRDLLVEAYNTQRLLIAIPFTCSVLVEAIKSPIFSPPCAWTMEIVEILYELYEVAEIKIQLKFNIEVLFRDLGLDVKILEASTVIRTASLQHEEPEEELPTQLPDGIEGFSDLPMIHFGRQRAPAERFSPSTIIAEMAELASVLKHNYQLAHVGPAIQNRIKQIFTTAVERAVSEIIGPVVERSVTIAAISASQLIAKDYALEPNGDRYQSSAHAAVRALSGSLAGVTCKEPLRTSITQNIQLLRQDLPDQAIAPGSVLMFVNENLEDICNIVEKAAENASIIEIDAQIEDPLRIRREGHYYEPQLNRWSYFMPEPFKPTSGGLNREQLAIYEEFGRTPRSAAGHNSLALDSNRHLENLLGDNYNGGVLPSSGDPMALSRAGPYGGAMQSPVASHLVNGFAATDEQSINDRLISQVAGLHKAAKEANDNGQENLLIRVQTVREGWDGLRDSIISLNAALKDGAALTAAQEIAKFLYLEPQGYAVNELLANILRKICTISAATHQQVDHWCSNLDEGRLFNAPVTIALLRTDLMDIRHIDISISLALQQRKIEVLDFMMELVISLITGDSPTALRADLAHSLSNLTYWVMEDPELGTGKELLRMLQDPIPQIPSPSEDEPDAQFAQISYILDEWTCLRRVDASHEVLVSFVMQLQSTKALGTPERNTLFFRACVDACVDSFEAEALRPDPSIDEAYEKSDAVAKLIILTVAHQAKVDGTDSSSKVELFESILSLLVLILSHHYQTRGHRFNQKVFYRLFSAILYAIRGSSYLLDGTHEELIQSFGRSLMLLQPQIFPGFSFAWSTLVAHRVFLPTLLTSHDAEAQKLFSDLFEKYLAYVAELMKPNEADMASKEHYRGCVKVLLLLHHDFPEYLCENHFQLLNLIPLHCTQMRGLIVSAAPASAADPPDFFTEGLKVDRLDDVKRLAIVRGDVVKPLRDAAIIVELDGLLHGGDAFEEHLDSIIQMIYRSDNTVIHALVLYTIQNAEAQSHPRALSFSASSPHARLLDGLAEKLGPRTRYQFISAVADQLRYTCNYTYYASYVMCHLFRASQSDRVSMDIKQQITRVLLERLVVHRPHPWGLIIVLVELLKNRDYRFWELPFMKAAPDLERMLQTLFAQMGQSGQMGQGNR